MVFGVCLRGFGLNSDLGPGDENEFLLYRVYVSFWRNWTHFDLGGHQIFNTFLVQLMVWIGGDENAVAIRFPSFILGVGVLPFIYLISRKIFSDIWVARISLFIAAISPIHIHYSQVARGYSIIIFFSAAALFFVLKIFETKRFKVFGTLLVISGFLSVYTLPTNVYFFLALAVWIGLVLFVPSYWRTQGYTSEERKGLFFGFLIVFLSMGMVTFIFYWPFFDQIVDAANNYYKSRVGESVWQNNLSAVSLIFQKNLVYFVPFIFVGIFCVDKKVVYCRLLPLVIFFFPIGFCALVGISGFPRNFLFNFPILVVFASAGLLSVGSRLSKALRLKDGLLVNAILVSLFVSFSLYYVWNSVYLRKKWEGKDYKVRLLKNSDPLDLLIVNKSNQYLYARTLIAEKIKNIVQSNKLTGLKFISPNENDLKNFQLSNGVENISLFKQYISAETLRVTQVKDALKMFTLIDKEAISILDDDFEAKANWKLISGKGTLSLEKDSVLNGRNSLKISSAFENHAVFQASVERKMILDKHAWSIFIVNVRNLTESKLYKDNSFYFSFPIYKIREKIFSKFLIGPLNPGMNLRIENEKNGLWAEKWSTSIYMSFVPRGEYIFNIQLGAQEDQTVLMDGIRFFLWPIPNSI